VIITSAPIRCGAALTARTPIIELTECPTKVTSRRSSSSQISTTSRAYPSSEEYRSSVQAVRSELPAPT
jgi:hypothetical protein